MSLENFQAAVTAITQNLTLPAGPALAEQLAQIAPPGSTPFQTLAALCKQGVAENWLADRTAGGIRYGRAIKASPTTHHFSVDVVEMDDIAGPFHAHPNGEIDMILPLDPEATFDGQAEGWLVYAPGTRHAPTVRGGRAIILYLLPEGAIDFKATP